ncbi:MAG TPA: redoxin domain-containing protein [bacterium]|nr:redoxin domain-containing protein [bacterium]
MEKKVKAKIHVSRLIFTLLLATLVFFFHLKLKESPSEKQLNQLAGFFAKPRLLTGITAPSFETTLLSGEKFRLAEVAGRKCVILNFFATWCEPCRREMPGLNKFYQRYSRQDVYLLGICSESREKVERFIQEEKVSFPVALYDGQVEEKFAIDSYPTTVVIDARGKVVLYQTGAIYNTAVTLEPEVNRTLSDLRKGRGISQEEFVRASRLEAEAGVWPGRKKKKELSEQEKRLARKIYCPRGCGKNLLECNCSMCKKAIEEMKTELAAGLSEEQVVKKINTRYCSEK